ncbi:hypothetical protein PILCRDRAFT_2038 [Piloderma croceum F 1598]|uniref:Uncharacterized protein n=1 Tax=Piloderma croceum (strain F 1598) TaxID=765440 RepID=A0A0C3CJ49_PILCF|nr:hypothetical protein PILCRDRAFT_2038 [Piloderma croceum F 1598]
MFATSGGSHRLLIKGESISYHGDVGPHTLELWKVNIDLKTHYKHSLSHLKLENLEGVEELTSWKGKHAAPEPTEGVFDHLKCAKIVTNAPSDTGKSAIYERLQEEPSEKNLDGRPELDPDIPPIPFLYNGFGHFLDIMDARDDVPGLADVDVLELRKAVDDLASKMTGYFSKDDRRDAALPCLNRIFSARRGINIPPLYAATIGSVGHNTATHGAL